MERSSLLIDGLVDISDNKAEEGGKDQRHSASHAHHVPYVTSVLGECWVLATVEWWVRECCSISLSLVLLHVGGQSRLVSAMHG